MAFRHMRVQAGHGEAATQYPVKGNLTNGEGGGTDLPLTGSGQGSSASGPQETGAGAVPGTAARMRTIGAFMERWRAPVAMRSALVYSNAERMPVRAALLSTGVAQLPMGADRLYTGVAAMRMTAARMNTSAAVVPMGAVPLYTTAAMVYTGTAYVRMSGGAVSS